MPKIMQLSGEEPGLSLKTIWLRCSGSLLTKQKPEMRRNSFLGAGGLGWAAAEQAMCDQIRNSRGQEPGASRSTQQRSLEVPPPVCKLLES